MCDRLFGTAASMIPQDGINSVATVAPMIVLAILTNVSININISEILDSLPGRDVITNMVIQNVIDTVILTRESFTMNPVV